MAFKVLMVNVKEMVATISFMLDVFYACSSKNPIHLLNFDLHAS